MLHSSLRLMVYGELSRLRYERKIKFREEKLPNSFFGSVLIRVEGNPFMHGLYYYLVYQSILRNSRYIRNWFLCYTTAPVLYIFLVYIGILTVV